MEKISSLFSGKMTMGKIALILFISFFIYWAGTSVFYGPETTDMHVVQFKDEYAGLCDFQEVACVFEKTQVYQAESLDQRQETHSCSKKERTFTAKMKRHLAVYINVNLCGSDVLVHGDTVEVLSPVAYGYSGNVFMVDKNIGKCCNEYYIDADMLEYQIITDFRQWVTKLVTPEKVEQYLRESIPFKENVYVFKGGVKVINDLQYKAEEVRQRDLQMNTIPKD